MTWGFSAQRRADQFDTWVESASRPDPADGSPRDAELLELVGALRSVPVVTARPEFVSELRAQLMAEAATALAGPDTSRLRLPERRPRRERRLAAAIGGIAVVGVTTGVAFASQSALPGEALYPVKRVIENAHAGLSVGDGNRGSTILANATDRLDEADALVRQDGFGADLRVSDTLSTFTDQAVQGSDLLLADYAHHGDSSSIAEVHEFNADSLDRLAALEPLVPASARDELIRAARTVQTIDAEATDRCPDCGTPVESIPPVLAAAQQAVVAPAPPRPSAPSGSGHHAAGPKGPALPTVQPGDVGPGSVTDPVVPGPTGSTGPLQALTDGLADALGGGADTSGGKKHPSRTPSPSPSTVGEAVDGAVDGVGAILGSVVDGVDGVVGGLSSPAP